MRQTEVLAHRTGMANFPENSWEGLVRCARNGANAIECDITFTKDGKAAVWAGDISDLSFEEMAGFKRKAPPFERIMGIKNIWRFLEKYSPVTVFLDVKYYSSDILGHFRNIGDKLINTVIREIIEPTQRRGFSERIGFVTFAGGAGLLERIKKIDLKIHTSLITVFPWTEIEHHFPYLDSVTVGWNWMNRWMWKLFDKKLERILKKAHEHGLKIYGGHANTENDILWLLDKKFDGIWTDDVLFAQKFLKDLKERRGR